VSGVRSDAGGVQPTLPRGRHRLSAEEVADNQRLRLIEALISSVSQRGYAATSVERILEGAGVSRGTFYQLFDNRQECLLAAHELALEGLTRRLDGACAGEPSWDRKASAAIEAAVDFAAEEPGQARLLILDTLAADSEGSQRGLAAIDRFAGLLRGGRTHHPRAASLPESAERALVGSVSMTIFSRLLSGEPVAELKPQLVYLVLAPYVGRDEAERLASSSPQS
jgi:AcrR family transcriptional regulator